jgi:ABC-2 type transport system ATP-binding protein
MNFPRIKCENLSKTFQVDLRKKRTFLSRMISRSEVSETEKTVLGQVTFSVEKGEICGLIGDNGSGKTTLLRVLAGIYSNDGGSYTIDGRLAPFVGFGDGLIDKLTVEENTYLVGSLYGMTRAEIKKKLPGILKFAELENFAAVKKYQLSNGMIQRDTL